MEEKRLSMKNSSFLSFHWETIKLIFLISRYPGYCGRSWYNAFDSSNDKPWYYPEPTRVRVYVRTISISESPNFIWARKPSEPGEGRETATSKTERSERAFWWHCTPLLVRHYHVFRSRSTLIYVSTAVIVRLLLDTRTWMKILKLFSHLWITHNGEVRVWLKFFPQGPLLTV
jgi:hypothetical protein